MICSCGRYTPAASLRCVKCDMSFVELREAINTHLFELNELAMKLKHLGFDHVRVDTPSDVGFFMYHQGD